MVRHQVHLQWEGGGGFFHFEVSREFAIGLDVVGANLGEFEDT